MLLVIFPFLEPNFTCLNLNFLFYITFPIDTYKFDDNKSNEEIKIESYEDATEYLNEIAENLSSDKSWKIRCEALDRTIKLLKAGIQYYPEGDLQGIAPLIATAIIDLRPVIIRKACLLVAIAAKLLKEDFSASAIVIFPSLLKQIPSKNSLISNYCHCSLLKIVKYTSTKQVGLLFINNYLSNVIWELSAVICRLKVNFEEY